MCRDQTEAQLLLPPRWGARCHQSREGVVRVQDSASVARTRAPFWLGGLRHASTSRAMRVVYVHDAWLHTTRVLWLAGVCTGAPVRATAELDTSSACRPACHALVPPRTNRSTGPSQTGLLSGATGAGTAATVANRSMR